MGGETASITSCCSSTTGLSPRGRGNRPHPSPPPPPLGSIPRVGGETAGGVRVGDLPQGLSPRGRGNLRVAARSRADSRPGSIPAWAGKPPVASVERGAWSSGLSPRGRETPEYLRSVVSQMGLSPRGRGNLVDDRDGQWHVRSIPAWAGNHRHGAGGHVCHGSIPRGRETTISLGNVRAYNGLSPRGRGNPDADRLSDACGTRVYPRVGGETIVDTTGDEAFEGLSPRGRGNHRSSSASPCPPRSIPAWAGKPSSTLPGRGIRGSIPAWAGKPSKLQCVTVPTAVYPRVGGETMMQCTVQSVTQGLSPRGRRTWVGSTSAWNTPGLSPRGRGNPHGGCGCRIIQRSIPAWAGDTRSRGAFPGRLTGLSPRGRGNLKRVVVDPALQRSIPAWAGKPQKSQ